MTADAAAPPSAPVGSPEGGLAPAPTLRHTLALSAARGLEALYGAQVPPAELVLQATARGHAGHFTLVLFPLLRRKLAAGPEALGQALGAWLVANEPAVGAFEVVKGFLNLTLADAHWTALLAAIAADAPGYLQRHDLAGQKVMVEFSSPNTNKPLHLGHLRNNFLGDAVCRILASAGAAVVRANLVNDRGVHICKSMWAWQQAGGGTPEAEGLKGDKLVGKYYVEFERRFQAEYAEWVRQAPQAEVAAFLKTTEAELEALFAAQDATPLKALLAERKEDYARLHSPAMAAVQAMLRDWEAGAPEVRDLWARMNGWVYAGFEATYRRMGIAFDQMYYESETYLLGKDIVAEGLEKGVFYKKDDGSVWADLTAEVGDHKLVLRADGTSVYITQDLGTADLKFAQHGMNRSVYVIGNEQDYHMKALIAILAKLERPYAPGMFHLSYGMVELPSGKMKSREGTVVDADDLMEEVVRSAEAETRERGKVEGLAEAELAALFETLGLGALKYFLLKIEPARKMLFDPAESVSLQGDTGPFIQYTHARIRSLLARAAQQGLTEAPGWAKAAASEPLLPEEVAVVQALADYPEVLLAAAGAYNPSGVAAYALELAKAYNRFYNLVPVLREAAPAVLARRLALSRATADTLRHVMGLLGAAVPDRM